MMEWQSFTAVAWANEIGRSSKPVREMAAGMYVVLGSPSLNLPSPDLIAISQQLPRLTSFRLPASSINVFAVGEQRIVLAEPEERVGVKEQGHSMYSLNPPTERRSPAPSRILFSGSYPPCTATRSGRLLDLGQGLSLIRDEDLLARLKAFDSSSRRALASSIVTVDMAISLPSCEALLGCLKMRFPDV